LAINPRDSFLITMTDRSSQNGMVSVGAKTTVEQPQNQSLWRASKTKYMLNYKSKSRTLHANESQESFEDTANLRPQYLSVGPQLSPEAHRIIPSP
jgi:hypothetical protein